MSKANDINKMVYVTLRGDVLEKFRGHIYFTVHPKDKENKKHVAMADEWRKKIHIILGKKKTELKHVHDESTYYKIYCGVEDTELKSIRNALQEEKPDEVVMYFHIVVAKKGEEIEI